MHGTEVTYVRSQNRKSAVRGCDLVLHASFLSHMQGNALCQSSNCMFDALLQHHIHWLRDAVSCAAYVLHSHQSPKFFSGFVRSSRITLVTGPHTPHTHDDVMKYLHYFVCVCNSSYLHQAIWDSPSTVPYAMLQVYVCGAL